MKYWNLAIQPWLLTEKQAGHYDGDGIIHKEVQWSCARISTHRASHPDKYLLCIFVFSPADMNDCLGFYQSVFSVLSL